MATLFSRRLIQASHSLLLTTASLVIITTCLYLLTLARTHVSYGDSDELTIVGYLDGVAHPPGYPLLVSLLSVFTHIPGFISVAFKANLLALVIQVFNVCLIYFISKSLLKRIKPKVSFLHTFFAALGSIFTAVSIPFWLQASVIEKYSLLLLLMLITTWLTLKLEKASLHYWLAFGGVIGLGLVYHPLFCLLIPPLVLRLLNLKKLLTQQKVLAITGGISIGSLLSLLTLWELNAKTLPFSYRFPATLEGLISHVLRITYHASAQASQMSSSVNPSAMVTGLEHYFSFSVTSFMIVGMLFAFLGWWYYQSQYPTLFHWLGLAIIFTGPGLAFLLGNQVSAGLDIRFSWYMLERFYLLSYGFVGILIPIGMMAATEKWILIKKHIPLFCGICVGIICFTGLHTYPFVNLSQYTVVEQSTTEILESLPDKALLVIDGDIATFSLIYQHTVEHKREDVSIVPVNPHFRSHFFNQSNFLTPFSFSTNPTYVLDIIAQNISQRPVFVMDLTAEYYQLLGLTEGIYFAYPHNQMLRLYATNEAKTAATPTYSKSYVPTKVSFYPYFQVLQAHRLGIGSFILAEAGQRDTAAEYVTRAGEVYPYQPYQYSQQLLPQLATYPVNDYYSKEKQPLTDTHFLAAAQVALTQNNAALARSYATGAYLKNPKNPEVHKLLATIYQSLGNSVTSQEYQHSYDQLLQD